MGPAQSGWQHGLTSERSSTLEVVMLDTLTLTNRVALTKPAARSEDVMDLLLVDPNVDRLLRLGAPSDGVKISDIDRGE